MDRSQFRELTMRKRQSTSQRIRALVGIALWMIASSLCSSCRGGDSTEPPDQPSSLNPGDYDRTLEVDGRTRSYILHVPPSDRAIEPAPLVLAFHGGGTNAQALMDYCDLNDKADEAGFLLVYPNGTGALSRVLTFNTGNCCGYAMEHGVDDVAFIREILADLRSITSIDDRRIYATGISNGGMMAYLVAARLADEIAAIAPISGPMGTETADPSAPVSVIHFHGTADRSAPFEGGIGDGVSGTDFYSVQHSIDAWVAIDQCPSQPIREELPDQVEDGTSVIRHTYGPGTSGTEVVLIEIVGGGHTWPDKDVKLPRFGLATHDISANDMMWEFFQRHPKSR